MKKSFLLLSSLLLLITGCVNQHTIKDLVTVEEIPIVYENDQAEIILFRNDSMVRKEAEFYDKKIVIDHSYYRTHKIQRGDIIYFKIPTSNTLPTTLEADMSRIIGLEGETVSIKNASIYINNNKLDTFYGELRVNGLNKKENFEADDPGCAKDCQETRRTFFNTKLEIVVPEGTVFILSDNTLRGLGSLNFGPLNSEDIIGKVLGYSDK